MPLPTGGGGSRTEAPDTNLPTNRSGGTDLGDITFPDAPIIEENDVDNDLILPADHGLSTPAPTDPLLLAKNYQNTPAPVDPLLLAKNKQQPTYVPVPADPMLMQRTTAQTLQKIIGTGEAAWWDTQAIQNELRALVDLPRVAHVTTPKELAGSAEGAVFGVLGNAGYDYAGETYTPEQFDEQQEAIAANAALWEDSDRNNAKWLLENLDVIEQMQQGYYTSVVAAPLHAPEGVEPVGGDEDILSQMMADFGTMAGDSIPPELSKYLASAIAIMPDTQKITREAGIEPAEKWSGWWNLPTFISSRFETGLEVWSDAPEAIRGNFNDYRAQLLTEAYLFTTEADFTNLEDRGKFLDLVNLRMYNAIDEVERNKSGVGAFLDKTVGLGFIANANVVNDQLVNAANWLHNSSNPTQWVNAQQLSLGQTFAMQAGVNPADDHYQLVSGATDGFANLSIIEPVNAIAGVGAGIRNASRFARPVGYSITDTLKDAIKPVRSGVYADIPLFDTGVTARFTYAFLAKTTDEMMQTKRWFKTASKIADETSETKIAKMVPGFAQSPKLLRHLANNADTPEMVTELVRAAVHAPTLLGTDAPLLASRTADNLRLEVNAYRDARQAYMDAGGSLADMGQMDEIHVVLQHTDADFYRQVASGEFADEIRESGRAVAADRKAVNKMVTRGEEWADPDTSMDKIFGVKRSDAGQVTSPKTGEIFQVRKVVQGEDAATFDYLVYAEDGTPLGGVAVINGEITMGLADRARGVMDQLWDIAYDDSNDLLRLHGASPSTSEVALDFGQRYAETRMDRLDNANTFKIAKVNGDGTRKVAVSATGARPSIIDLQQNIDGLGEYLVLFGLNEDAAALTMAAAGAGSFRLADLSPRAQEITQRFIAAKSADMGYWGDDMIVTPRARDNFVRGMDTEPSEINMYDSLLDESRRLAQARMDYTDFRTAQSPTLWLVADPALSLPSWTAQVRRATSNNSTKGWMRLMRRMGAQMTHATPSNISLTDVSSGTKSLEAWFKLLGGTDELAAKWIDEYRNANPALRYEVLHEAMKELGEQIGDPALSMSLIDFVEKDGHRTFFHNRTGVEIGLTPDGRVQPLTLSHLTTDFVMPDIRQVIKANKRFNFGKKMPKRLVNGFKNSGETAQRRSAIVERLKLKAQRTGADLEKMTEDDWMAMAYADVIGQDLGLGQMGGYGMLAKSVNRYVSRPYQAFHNVFTISQLAARPIAWSSRVLLEEQIRANMMGLPVLWRNPSDYAWQMADAHGIRRLPKVIEAQSAAVEKVVDEVFKVGAEDAIPGLSRMLDEAGIAAGDTERVRVFVADTIGKELMGLSDTTIGSHLNIPMDVARRQKKLKNLYARMARDGLDEEFRWTEGGADIAQRSVWQSFRMEAESATVPLEWNPTAMSRRQQEVYGRGYGRQVYQMVHDPIVGSYGINRAIALAAGNDTTWTAEKLVASSRWQEIRHIVEENLARRGEVMTETQMANWYLENVVDEIVATLFDPLATDLADRVRLLKGLQGGGRTELSIGGRTVKLNADRANYEGFVNAFKDVATGAYVEGRNLPPKISAYFDPRYGQEIYDDTITARARKLTDWIMNHAGEAPTQAIHRQPAFKHLHGKHYRQYRRMGWDHETATTIASRKAAETVNYIFFDNKNLPMFLKNMNRYIPFFSAMFEVGSTWAYKIPSVETLPAGYLHLGRRVQRTIRGLHQTGLVSTDPESGQMSLLLTNDMDHATSREAAAVGKTMKLMMDGPRVFIEHLAGLAEFASGGWDEGYAPADFQAWSKDGYQIGLGNPLDPTSSGLMAVNQFSVGASPILAFPAGIAAEAVFTMDDEMRPASGTVAEFFAENDDLDFATILNANRDEFKAVNSDEAFNRALSGDFDWNELQMPDHVRIPSTSLWETLIDRTFFPFGKMQTPTEIAWAPTPSAVSHVWRGIFQQIEEHTDLNATELIGWTMGETSEAAQAGEVLNQLQMIEAADGSITRVLDMTAKAERLIEELQLDIATNPDTGFRRILNPEDNPEGVAQIQELWDAIAEENARITRRAAHNAAGSSILRGVMGMLGPATPRMWDREQEQIATYWAANDMAKKAEETGHIDWAEGIRNGGVNSVDDLKRITGLVDAWLEGEDGDAAKVFIRENYPHLFMYTQGKSYWGESGPPVFSETFDGWVEQIEAGDRYTFDPEVYMARYWRNGIAVDREQAIRSEYGTDPATAVQKILADPAKYRDLTEDYDSHWDAIDFIDAHLLDGKYAQHRATKLEDLSVLEELTDRSRATREEADRIQQLISYGNLDPAERRRLNGLMLGAVMDEAQALDEARTFADTTGYRNERERLMDTYYETVKNPYREQYSTILNDLETATNKYETSLAWEKARQLDDETYQTRHFIDYNGQQVEVPAPQTHSWNGISQQERQERMMSMLARKPEWLSMHDMDIFIRENPQAAAFFPRSPEQRVIYDWATDEKSKLREEYLSEGNNWTQSAYEKKLAEVDNELERTLREDGRTTELEFRDAVPLQKLDMLGMVPRSLEGMVPVLNQVITELRMIDKSPTTNAGYDAFRQMKQWLESDYFVANPSARGDLQNIAWAMYGTKVDSVVLARLLQGESYGELE